MLEANFLNTSTECYFANFFETYGWSQPAIGNQGLIFSQVHKEHAEIFSSETTQRVHCCDIALDYPIAYNGIFCNAYPIVFRCLQYGRFSQTSEAEKGCPWLSQGK